MANGLPQGFVLDTQQPPQPAQGLPPGFSVDTDSIAEQSQGITQDVITSNVGDRGDLPGDILRPELAQEPTFGEEALGVAEVAGTVLSSAIAEPIAGLSGLVSAAFGGITSGVDTVNIVQNALTFEPRSKEGKAKLKSLGEFVQPLGEAIGGVESALGNAVLEATGSPELAAIAHSLPTAALEAFGVKGLRGAKLKDVKLSSNVGQAIQQASPALDDLNTLKTSAYNEIDNIGIKIKSAVYDRFADNLADKLKKEAIDRTITPKSQAALDRILEAKGTPKTLTEMDTLRKIAKGAANDIDKTESRLGSIIIDEIDTGLDNLSSEIGGKFKDARGLAQRAFKAQDLQDLLENASLQASGFENGLRIGARQLLKNKKRIKGFTADEKSALRSLVEGDLASNTAKKLSRLGFGQGQATNHLGASAGIGGGGVLGSFFGPAGTVIGVVTPPIIGKVAANTVERLTLNKLKFAEDLTRAGKNAKAVTRAYLKNTPIKNRNVDDLTGLLLDNNLDLNSIKSLPKSASATAKLIADSKFFAEEIRRRAGQVASVGLITTPRIQEQQ